MKKKEQEVMLMPDSRELTSVKLTYGGLHGVVVSYTDIDVSREIRYKNEYKNVKFGAPASGDLINSFDALKGHLLDICGYPLEGDDRSVLNNLVELTGVCYAPSKGFILIGTLDVLDGKKLSLTTPLIQGEGELPEYGDIVEKIKKLYADAKEYLTGRSRMGSLEMVEMLNKKKQIDGFDMEAFKGLSAGEQLKMAIEIAEEAGCMVLKSDEVELDENKVAATVEKYDAVKPSLVAPVVEETDEEDFSI